MRFLRNSLIIIAVGAVYNLYFTLLNGGLDQLVNFTIFFILANATYYIIKYIFIYTKFSDSNGYIQIIIIFIIGSMSEITYGLLSGMNMDEIARLVLIGLPITLIGLIYWWYYSKTLQDKLAKKKSRLLNSRE